MSKDQNKDWAKIEKAREEGGCLSVLVAGPEDKQRKAVKCTEKGKHTVHGDGSSKWWYGPDNAGYHRWQINPESPLQNINTQGASGGAQPEIQVTGLPEEVEG